MANPLLPRARVHAWSEQISEQPQDHSAAIQRLLKDQRRLSRFVEENASSMQGMSGGVAMYLVGVILRMFDLAGGRMRKGTWDDVRAVEKRIGGQVEQLLPVDDGFVQRARSVPRAQAHILDEALYALFVRDDSQDESEGSLPEGMDQKLDELEAFKVYMLMWVATEVLDDNWTPPSSFEGDGAYQHAPLGEGEA